MLKTLAVEALKAQDACNPAGLASAYGGHVVHQLRDALKEAGLPHDNHALASHPINRLWVSKLHDLAGMGVSDLDKYHDATVACEVLAAG